MSLFALHAFVAANAGPPIAPTPARPPLSPAECARLDREAETARQMRDLRAALEAEMAQYWPEACDGRN